MPWRASGDRNEEGDGRLAWTVGSAEYFERLSLPVEESPMKALIALSALALFAVGCSSNGSSAMKASYADGASPASGTSMQRETHNTWRDYKVIHSPPAASQR